MKLKKIDAFKLILFFSAINSSIFYIYYPQGYSFLRFSMFFSLIISVALLLIYSFRGIIKETGKRRNISLYFQSLLFLLFLWSTFVIFRSFHADKDTLLTLFGHFLMAWAWITPLTIILGFYIQNWIALFKFLSRLLIIGVVISVISVLIFAHRFGSGALEWLKIFPVLLLTVFHQGKKIKTITITSFISFIIISIYISERINSVYVILVLIFFLIEFLKQKKIKVQKKLFTMSLILLMIIGSVLYSRTFIRELSSNEEITTDTRTFLLLEFLEDMNTEDLIFGRGALGTYYSPYFSYTEENNLGGDSSKRISIEIGYLEMILKGGYILMALNLLILIPAAFLGIFRSKNIIARMSGYIIVLYLVIWPISYYPVYSLEFLILWMAVGTAISKKARNIKDKDILFKKKGKLHFKNVISRQNVI